MKTFQVEIKGTYALLQCRFNADDEAGLEAETRTIKKTKITPREEAEANSYRAKDGALYHPSSAILAVLKDAGSYYKQKGSRKSLRFVVPAAVRLTSEIMPLFDGAGKPAKDFEVDRRRVVNKHTKGAVVCSRPRLDEWSARFNLVMFDDVIDTDTVHELLVMAGQRLGIGSYRPTCGGPFGTFAVTIWQEIKESNGAAAGRRVPELSAM